MDKEHFFLQGGDRRICSPLIRSFLERPQNGTRFLRRQEDDPQELPRHTSEWP